MRDSYENSTIVFTNNSIKHGQALIFPTDEFKKGYLIDLKWHLNYILKFQGKL